MQFSTIPFTTRTVYRSFIFFGGLCHFIRLVSSGQNIGSQLNMLDKITLKYMIP